MTHDDCYLWFMQLEDVFSSQGITSQITKCAALTTLLTEDEAYVVRDLTLMGDDRPMDVFDAAKKLFIHQYQLTVHQRLSQAFAMGGIQADEKPSQWMARSRHTGGEWEREDVERRALFRQLPNALRTALEVPTPQLTMDELLNAALFCFACRNNYAGTTDSLVTKHCSAVGRPAPDIIRAYLKVAQRSRETRRAIRKKRLLFAAGYLVDCGFAVSVLPPTSEERQNPNSTEYNLYSANGQRICTYGRRLVAFKLFGHACSHDTIIADVVRPILGMDFVQDGDVKCCLIDPLKRC